MEKPATLVQEGKVMTTIRRAAILGRFARELHFVHKFLLLLVWTFRGRKVSPVADVCAKFA